MQRFAKFKKILHSGFRATLKFLLCSFLLCSFSPLLFMHGCVIVNVTWFKRHLSFSVSKFLFQLLLDSSVEPKMESEIHFNIYYIFSFFGPVIRHTIQNGVHSVSSEIDFSFLKGLDRMCFRKTFLESLAIVRDYHYSRVICTARSALWNYPYTGSGKS